MNWQTIFSSNLVELRASEGETGRTHLSLSGDFWIYVVLSIGVTLLTLAAMLWLNRRWLKYDNSGAPSKGQTLSEATTA
jgi:hypothetical protein